jgi:hypothetical protein
MEASLTYYSTVLVISRSDQPGQNYDAKSVPLCLVRSVRLCHSYSVTRNLVRATRKRYQKPMPKGQALCKLASRTIQRWWSYQDRTNLDKVHANSVPLSLVRSVRLCHSYSVTRILVCVTRIRYQEPMPKGQALCKLDSRTIQR